MEKRRIADLHTNASGMSTAARNLSLKPQWAFDMKIENKHALLLVNHNSTDTSTHHFRKVSPLPHGSCPLGISLMLSY